MGKCATPRVTRNSHGLRASSTEPEGAPATPLRRSSRLSNTPIATPSTPPNRVTKTRKNTRPKRATNFETAVATKLSPISDAGEQPNPTVTSEEEPIPAITSDDEPQAVITSENEFNPIIPTEDEPNSTIQTEDELNPIIPSEDELQAPIPTEDEPNSTTTTEGVSNPTIPSEDESKPTVSPLDEDDFSDLDGPLFVDSPIRSTKIQEDVSHETEKFAAHKKEEGHRFGRKLYNTIQTDHEKRGCECGLPTIYATLEEALAGEGTFRFYYKDGWSYQKIWVFMRKDDRRWHYQCDAQYLSDFACWVRKEKRVKEEEQNRKRKAEEDAREQELELEQFRARRVARLVEPGVNRWDHWRVSFVASLT
jgi:GNAT superfamily N-acetyltransferase